jgi:pimeloyl-ACP methyl ester carboxylesterase
MSITVNTYPVWGDGHQLQLKRLYCNSDGSPVVLVPGFGETAGQFFDPQKMDGLAVWLVEQGLDVFIAEGRGKGDSCPQVNRALQWGLNELITQDLPAQLSYIEQLKPDQPQLWIGQGLGGLLLACCYARYRVNVRGMVYLGTARRCELQTLPKSLSYMGWRFWQGCKSVFQGKAGKGDKRAESRLMWQQMAYWHHSIDWIDPQDGFDYRRALHHKGMPASLYLAKASNTLFGNLHDTRCWLKELGDHDAQLVAVKPDGSNKTPYLNEYEELQSWLQRQFDL